MRKREHPNRKERQEKHEQKPEVHNTRGAAKTAQIDMEPIRRARGTRGDGRGGGGEVNVSAVRKVAHDRDMQVRVTARERCGSGRES